jgi:hypothetical protein
VKYLHAPEVGAHQADRAVQDAFVQGVSIALLNERGADFLQKQRVVRTCIRSCLAIRLVFLVRHRRRQICEPVGELIVAGDTQPALLHGEVIGFQGGVGGRLRFALRFGRTLMAHPNLITQLLEHDDLELDLNTAGTPPVSIGGSVLGKTRPAAELRCVPGHPRHYPDRGRRP